jgi:beta-galactosidase beta subunit
VELEQLAEVVEQVVELMQKETVLVFPQDFHILLLLVQ